MEKIQDIHNSLVNGQRKQMADQIDDYLLYDFWADYERFLFKTYVTEEARYEFFADAVKSYHRIRNR